MHIYVVVNHNDVMLKLLKITNGHVARNVLKQRQELLTRSSPITLSSSMASTILHLHLHLPFPKPLPQSPLTNH